jgi:hypothetical protein
MGSQIQKEGSNRTIHLHYGGSTDKLIMTKSASPMDVIGISEYIVSICSKVLVKN